MKHSEEPEKNCNENVKNPQDFNYHFYSLSICFIISAKAGLVTNTPTVMPISVVTAKPFSKPAPAAPIPINPKNPVNGTRETKAVANDVKIMKSALEILSFNESDFCLLDSSSITI